MQNYSYTCTEDDKNKRLDYVLKFLFPLLGLRVRRRLCEEEFVCVNGKIADASKKMRAHYVVTVNIPSDLVAHDSTCATSFCPDSTACYDSTVQNNTDFSKNTVIFQDNEIKNISYFFGGNPSSPNILLAKEMKINQEDNKNSYIKKSSSQKTSSQKSSSQKFSLCRLAWGMSVDNVNIKNFVLKETNEFAAVFKPPFVHSAYIAYKKKKSSSKSKPHMYDIESLLPQLFPHKEPILLNRLDFATSGILMVAFSEDAVKKWKNTQKMDRIKKFYLCLTEGDLCSIKKENQLIDIQGAMSVKKSQKVRVDPSIKGDRLTRILPLFSLKTKKNETFSLVFAEITKGARHQIRAHLASIGHPLVGDSKYNAKKPTTYQELITTISQTSVPCLDELPKDLGREVFFLHHMELNFLDFHVKASLNLLPIATQVAVSLFKEIQKKIVIFYK